LISSAAIIVNKLASSTATIPLSDHSSKEGIPASLIIGPLNDLFHGFQKRLPSLNASYPLLVKCFSFVETAFAWSLASLIECSIFPGREHAAQESALVGNISDILRIGVVSSALAHFFTEQLFISLMNTDQVLNRILSLLQFHEG
jgi:hypothetical protein